MDITLHVRHVSFDDFLSHLTIPPVIDRKSVHRSKRHVFKRYTDHICVIKYKSTLVLIQLDCKTSGVIYWE